MVRHKRNSFGDTFGRGMRPLVGPSTPLAQRPMLFYWFMGFFSREPPSHTSERADWFFLSLFCFLSYSLACLFSPFVFTNFSLTLTHRAGNNKKEQMPAAIKTTESIKNFRPFTACPEVVQSCTKILLSSQTRVETSRNSSITPGLFLIFGNNLIAI